MERLKKARPLLFSFTPAHTGKHIGREHNVISPTGNTTHGFWRHIWRVGFCKKPVQRHVLCRLTHIVTFFESKHTTKANITIVFQPWLKSIRVQAAAVQQNARFRKPFLAKYAQRALVCFANVEHNRKFELVS